MDQRTLTLADLAELLGVSAVVAYRLMKGGGVVVWRGGTDGADGAA